MSINHEVLIPEALKYSVDNITNKNNSKGARESYYVRLRHVRDYIDAVLSRYDNEVGRLNYKKRN